MRTAIEWNHSSLVNHFLENRDVAWRLYNLLAVAIDHRKYGSRYAAGDATNVVREVFRCVGFGIVVSGTIRDAARYGLGKKIGSSSVRRIHDKRSLLTRTTRSLAPVTRRAGSHTRIGSDILLLVIVRLP